MKIIVTGGAGFIGSHLYEALTNNHEVRIIDNLSTGFISNLPQNCKILQKDIREVSAKDFEDIEVVFHCAALARVQPSIANPTVYNDVNVNGTLNVLECCKQAKVKRLIFSSSSSVYGDSEIMPTAETFETKPLSPYGLQKLIGEQYCKLYSKLYSLDTVCLRYFNVYGERMPTQGSYKTAIGTFIRQKKNKEHLSITNDGNQKRDFTYVKDVVEANIKAMNYNNLFDGECINIGRGMSYSINEIAASFNCPIKYIGSVVEPRFTLADVSKAESLLQWMPSTNVLDWIKQQYE